MGRPAVRPDSARCAVQRGRSDSPASGHQSAAPTRGRRAGRATPGPAAASAVAAARARAGVLVYATCSVLRRENDEQIAAFLATAEPALEGPGTAQLSGCQNLPGDADGDGFYYAWLRKPARAADRQCTPATIAPAFAGRGALLVSRGAALRSSLAAARSACAGFRGAERGAAAGADQARKILATSKIRRRPSQLENGVYFLTRSRRVSIVDGSARRAAVRRAAAHPLDVELVEEPSLLVRQRRTRRCGSGYQLEYHALSERFIVHEREQRSIRTSFSTLLRRSNWLGRVDHLPLIDASLIEPGPASTTRGCARFSTWRSSPGPLRLLAFWRRDWSLGSDWYRWQLQDG